MLETILGQEHKPLFFAVCDELAKKLPEKAEHLEALKREATNYPNFPVAMNLSDLLVTYNDYLEDEVPKLPGYIEWMLRDQLDAATPEK